MATFDPNAGKEILLEEAKTMIKKYQTNNDGEVKAHYFSRASVNLVLLQPDAVGIRIYQATNESGERQLVLVGVDLNGKDLIEGKFADHAAGCPIACDPTSPFF